MGLWDNVKSFMNIDSNDFEDDIQDEAKVNNEAADALRGADSNGAGIELSGKLFPPFSGNSGSRNQTGSCEYCDRVCPVCAGSCTGIADLNGQMFAGCSICGKHECFDFLTAGRRDCDAGNDSAVPQQAAVRLRRVCRRCCSA